MIEITEDNYLNYLTYHGRSMDVAFRVVQKWGNYLNMPEYKNHQGVRAWVLASAMFLERGGE